MSLHLTGIAGAPDSAEWHAQRAKVVGASEVAALFGVQPPYALSHYALWQVKAGRVPPPVVDNPRVYFGLKLEPVIAECIAEQERLTIEKASHIADDTTQGMGCTPDYYVTAHEYADETGPGVLEIKNADWISHRHSWTDGEPPGHILLQLQHQLGCAGHSWGMVGCLIGGNELRIYRYRARPKLIAEIRRRVAEFWRSIEVGEEPPVDGSDGAAAVLRAMYATVDETPADLTADNEAPEICAEFLKAAAVRKAAEKVEAKWKNRLIAKLGPHTSAACEGFRMSVSVTAAKPDRVATLGEIIRGREEVRRYSVKEMSR